MKDRFQSCKVSQVKSKGKSNYKCNCTSKYTFDYPASANGGQMWAPAVSPYNSHLGGLGQRCILRGYG